MKTIVYQLRVGEEECRECDSFGKGCLTLFRDTDVLFGVTTAGCGGGGGV